MQTTIEQVAPKARLVRLAAPPVVGGVLLGMQQAGISVSSQREALLESTGHLLRTLKPGLVQSGLAG
jgi:hypothetical protein